MDKRFLFLMMAMFLILPMVSAWDWTESAVYSKGDLKVELKSYWGFFEFLGIDQTIGSFELKSHSSVDEVRKVGVGNEITMFYDFDFKEIYENGLGDVKFINMKTGRTIERNYKFVYFTQETRTRDVFEEICEDIDKNLTCRTEQVGKEDYVVDVWADFNQKDIPTGQIRIGIEVETKNGDYIDGIWNIAGKDISKHAVWNATLETGLMSWYRLDETSGTTAFDSLFANNGTNVGATVNQAGKIGKAYSFTNDYVTATSGVQGDTSITGTAWFKTSSTAISIGRIACFNAHETTASKGICISFEDGKTGKMAVLAEGVAWGTTSANSYNDGNWHFAVITQSGTSLTLYVDNVSVSTLTGTPSLSTQTTMGRNGGTNYQYVDGLIDEVGVWSRVLSISEITQLYNSGDGCTYQNCGTLPFVINLTSPANATVSSNASIIFRANVTTSSVVENISLVINNVINQTNTSHQNGSYSFAKTLADGSYQWRIIGYDENDVFYSSENRTLTIDTNSPTLTVASNITDLYTTSLPINSTWSFNASDPQIDKCFYNGTGIATKIVTCNSTIQTQWTTGGAKSLTYCANDTASNTICSSASLNIYDFVVLQGGSSTGADGTSTTFTFVINATSFPITDASATLWYNGVAYAPTSKTVNSANAITFTKTLIIPNGTGNSTGKPISWFWNYNSTQLTTRNSTVQNQTVYSVSITDCAITTGNTILSMSLKDEQTNTLVNVTAPNEANIELDLIITSKENSSLSWTFAKQWINNQTVSVCVPSGLLNASEYGIDFVVGYDNTLHVREFFYLEDGTLDNSTQFNSHTLKTINLMDLASADSTTFLFSFTDADNQEVDDIIVHTFRKYIGEGIFREVERSKQDNAGQTHVHLVEEDVIYYFMVTQYGIPIYTSDTYNAKCLSTPCEISLSASATETNWSIIDNEGGLYTTTSDRETRVVTTSFNLETIDRVNVSLYKFTNGSATLINTSSLTATAGSIELDIPLSYGNSTFFVSIFRNDTFVKSEWVNLQENGRDYFGTMGALLGGIIVLAMMLMAISEGAGFIVFTALALVIVGIMQLVDLGWMALISIVCAGGIIVWKLINRRSKQG